MVTTAGLRCDCRVADYDLNTLDIRPIGQNLSDFLNNNTVRCTKLIIYFVYFPEKCPANSASSITESVLDRHKC